MGGVDGQDFIASEVALRGSMEVLRPARERPCATKESSSHRWPAGF